MTAGRVTLLATLLLACASPGAHGEKWCDCVECERTVFALSLQSCAALCDTCFPCRETWKGPNKCTTSAVRDATLLLDGDTSVTLATADVPITDVCLYIVRSDCPYCEEYKQLVRSWKQASGKTFVLINADRTRSDYDRTTPLYDFAELVLPFDYDKVVEIARPFGAARTPALLCFHGETHSLLMQRDMELLRPAA